jgi:nitrate/nitrite-specific signal transduction histidine kinase
MRQIISAAACGGQPFGHLPGAYPGTCPTTNGHVTVCVEDDGVGISQTAARRTASRGILGMRERLLRFGGELSIASGEGGRGTRVCAVVPVLRRGENALIN